VVLGSATTYPFTREQWAGGTRTVIRELLSGGARVVVLAPSPKLPYDGLNCVVDNERAILVEHNMDACSVQLAAVENMEVVDALKQAVAGTNDATVLDLNDIVCPQGICRAWSAGKLTFRDDQHLNPAYVEDLTESVQERLRPYLHSSDFSKTTISQ
jgi:hypothetical protein